MEYCDRGLTLFSVTDEYLLSNANVIDIMFLESAAVLSTRPHFEAIAYLGTSISALLN